MLVKIKNYFDFVFTIIKQTQLCFKLRQQFVFGDHFVGDFLVDRYTVVIQHTKQNKRINLDTR